MISLRGPSRSTARRCTRPIRLLNAPLTKLAETRRRQPDRAPPYAPDGAFLADSLPQILRRDLRLPASANRLKIGLVGNLRVRRPFSRMRMKPQFLLACMLMAASGVVSAQAPPAPATPPAPTAVARAADRA